MGTEWGTDPRSRERPTNWVPKGKSQPTASAITRGPKAGGRGGARLKGRSQEEGEEPGGRGGARRKAATRYLAG